MKVQLLHITKDAEKLIEDAARTCYKSQKRAGYKHGSLIKALIKKGHLSVLEHASATFRVKGVSRALTHQLVRHRICSFSQQSQRYVSENQFEFVIPPAVYELDAAKNSKVSKVEEFKKDMATIQTMYLKWKDLGLKSEDARFVLPNACCTEIVMTANFREYRAIIDLRCAIDAQWEIRKLFLQILKVLSKKCPNVFEDQVFKLFGT